MTIEMTPAEVSAACLDSLVEATIEREYGRLSPGELAVARQIAQAAVMAETGGNASSAAWDLRPRLHAALEARRCACKGSHKNTMYDHRHGHCSNHTEADVPPLDGLLLCGTCHVLAHNAAHGIA